MCALLLSEAARIGIYLMCVASLRRRRFATRGRRERVPYLYGRHRSRSSPVPQRP